MAYSVLVFYYSAKKNHPLPLVDEVSRKGSEKFEWKKNDENMSFMNIWHSQSHYDYKFVSIQPDIFGEK